METKTAIDPKIILSLKREEAIAYYVRELGIDEGEATQIASTTHPGFVDVVRPVGIEPHGAWSLTSFVSRITHRLHAR